MKFMKMLTLFGIICFMSMELTSGYSISSSDVTPNEPNTGNGGLNLPDYEDVNSYEEGGRDKREVVEYDREVIFSPKYGYGYYIFPRSQRVEEIPLREFEPRRRSAHAPKRKKLFVPNLFG